MANKAKYKIDYDPTEDGFFLSEWTDDGWVQVNDIYYETFAECVKLMDRCAFIDLGPVFFDKDSNWLEDYES